MIVTDFIDCAHHLPGHGACARRHGHTYRIDLDLEGPIELAKIEAMLAYWDHIDLNQRLVFPSCENLCVALFRNLDAKLSGLNYLRVWEGHGKWAQVQRGDAEIADPAVGELI